LSRVTAGLCGSTVVRHNKHYVSNLTEFVRDADVLITDCTYFDDEYVTKVGWGHSCVGQVTPLAHDAGVRTLYLFHHDPDQTDDDIDRKTVTVQKALAALDSPTQCVGPTEGSSFTL
jgi:ribonuclease BN (tRNA processing enzyme)